ncbi:Rho GTPase (Miro-like) [Legionella gratiana]|uniref:Rho GTPase (Miro-like) n=1 Tax=Legionella gratiana TaxID=45066 RepID=A0A378JAH9_9GAMM|nr:Rab family GTPase [Legionella gratiana]KTD11041.1 Rho GTPase (Miro-like) [Legionella gratiana]STX44615.1 Rho GTPase (Miro-like) [Legionella gratiana]
MARFKVVLFGKQGSGKTQLSHQVALKGNYEENASSTVGVEYLSRKMEDNHVLHVWDIAGSEIYKKLYRSYYRGAILGLLCIDLTREIDQDQINNEVQLFRDICPNAPIILVGTKSDLPHKDIELFKKNIASELFSNYIVTSAKEKTGIDELYAEITKHCQGLNESLWNRAVQNLLVSLNELPPNKEKLIKAELEKLSKVLLAKSDELGVVSSTKTDAIEHFTNNCKTILEGKHPNVFKAVTTVAVAAAVTIAAAFIGFSISFFLGSWTGPGAFVTGFIGAYSAAVAVAASSITIGVAAGGITAYGLFKTSKEMSALNEFTADVSSWNREIRL